MRSVFLGAVVACLGVGLLARADDAAKAQGEARKMQGTWKPTTAELAGKPFPEATLRAMRLTLAGDKYAVTIGEHRDEGTMKVDPSRDPKAMDVTGTEGPNKGKTFLCIYELSGDTLRVCYDLSGQARPEEFKTKAGTQLFLVEYKRERDHKREKP